VLQLEQAALYRVCAVQGVVPTDYMPVAASSSTAMLSDWLCIKHADSVNDYKQQPVTGRGGPEFVFS
jgi:hypothetical protein